MTGMACNKSGSRLANGVGLRHLVFQPTPGFSFSWSSRLSDSDVEAGKFRLDLDPRQHVQTAHQHRALDYCRLRAIEALEGRMRSAVDNTAYEARPELMFAHLGDDEFEVR